MNSRNRIISKLSRIAILSISVTIPFWMFLNNITIAFSILLAIINLLVFRGLKGLGHAIYYPLIFLFLLRFASLFYSEDFGSGIQKIEHSLFFIIMPFIGYSFSPIMNSKLVKDTMKYFVWSVFSASIIFVIIALKNTWYFGSLNPFNETNGNFFLYFKFTAFIEDTHPIYFGTYVLFSLFVLSQDFFNEDNIFKLNKYLRLFVIGYLFLISLLLNSFLITILLFFWMLFCSFKLYSISYGGRIFKTGLIAVIFFFFLLSSVPVFEKFKGIDLTKDIFNKDFSGGNFTSVRARIAKWDSSWDLILDNFWFGVGVGDERKELLKAYSNNGFEHGIRRNFNSHNQYFTEWIYVGVLGFTSLIFLFLILFIRAIRTYNYYLLVLGIIYFFFNFTESAFVRNKGIVFFVFFACMLVNLNNKETSQLNG